MVAHFHYVLVPGSIFCNHGGSLLLATKMDPGHMYNEMLGKWHFWLSTIFVNLTFFPMHFVGLAGMPRRIPDYNLQFADYNMLASIGAFGFGLAQLLFLYIVLATIRAGKKASNEVWEGADGLEWTLTSPPPYHSFTTPPAVK